ncbi:sensor histidine kinase [Tautonia plasticadhaerens]|uniref:histidine kinase n=1 Tax=Tautonia plasticadhaerens TaxID=2527974 RepID=A0A518HFI5_9BACT|nr:sensor histidine kinase [Tautonia plasticadhaerens]QDV39591.1 Oxygen sensor histidine kinase NreB [Tautonia plasticadhaerens]
MDDGAAPPLVLVHCGWPADAELACRALGALGCACRVVGGADELQALLGGGPTDLMLADASAGLGPLGTLLAALDAHPEAGDLPLVLLADAADAPLLAGVLARSLHATLLTKPVTQAQFEAAVRAGLRYRAGRREVRRLLAELEGRVAERTAALAEANAALWAEIAARAALSRQLATAQEDERRRIARDLHDQTGQLLAGLALAVRAVADAGPLPAPAAERLADVRRVADELGRQVHELAVRLRPTALDDLGLEAALGQLAAEWSARAGVPVDFQAAGLEAGRLPTEVETVLYRVVQEALTNVAKHARAQSVSVVISRHGGSATAVIEDDGVGSDPIVLDHRGGRLGLVGMRERVSLVGGQLDIETELGRGTAIIARVPLAEGERGDGRG